MEKMSLGAGSDSSIEAMLKLATVVNSTADIELEAFNRFAEKRLEHESRFRDERKKYEDEYYQACIDMGIMANKTELNDRITREKEAAQNEFNDRLELLGKLSDAERAEEEKKHQDRLNKIEKELKTKYKKDEELQKKARAKAAKERKKDLEAQAKKEIGTVFGKGNTLAERAQGLKDLKQAAGTDGKEVNSWKVAADKLTHALGSYLAKLDDSIDSTLTKMSAVDTRLQGSANDKTFTGSYWQKMMQHMIAAAGVSPLVKQEDILNKIDDLVQQGISHNVEQRAFLATVSKKIASTFDATDGTLLKLVRVQQADSTAARLGMESSMNAFLNSMYETSEYLQSLASSVRSSLYEAEALIDSQSAVELEYQVQKWMGSMFSVGVKEDSVTSIANALGKVMSGQIEGLTSGGSSNLILMAANRANVPIANALIDGIDSSDTNKLLEAAVEYLAEIYDESKDNRVVQQQIANVYGVTASDLKAIANLARNNDNTMSVISGNSLSYNDAMNRLTTMANSMYMRTSIGELTDNIAANFNYTMASSIAANPVLYGIYKVANLLDDTTGGIALPDIKVMGTGVNLQTTVADLMRVGALSSGLLQGIGTMISTGGNGGITGSGMLRSLGIIGNNSSTSVQRGQGASITTSTSTVSSSGYVGNSNSSDIKSKSMQSAQDDANSQLVEQKESEDSDVPNKTIDEDILKIYKLLQSVVNGNAINVKLQNYGLSSSWNP